MPEYIKVNFKTKIKEMLKAREKGQITYKGMTVDFFFPIYLFYDSRLLNNIGIKQIGKEYLLNIEKVISNDFIQVFISCCKYVKCLL